MTQLLAEVTLEGIHKNILHRDLELVLAILPGASLGLAEVKPVGGAITTSPAQNPDPDVVDGVATESNLALRACRETSVPPYP